MPKVGRLFGPVMIIWFLAIGACGIAGIIDHPDILRALSPAYALGFLVGNFSIAFFTLAAVVLAVTGAEALYADMGHFGRPAITAGRTARLRVGSRGVPDRLTPSVGWAWDAITVAAVAQQHNQ